MKKEITRANERGQADHGWLQAQHYFSFADYYDPEKMGFGRLRVINDDRIAPGKGFARHPHRDMEIITIPQQGAVRHKDSKGNEGTIQKGEVQVMSAGKGILHSEYNASDSQDLSLFQIWIEPNKKSVEPRYDQASFDYVEKRNQWNQLVSPFSAAEETGVKIHQEAYINVSGIDSGKKLVYETKVSGNGLYLLVVDGEVEVQGEVLKKRDAIGLSGLATIEVSALQNSEVILLDVPYEVQS